MRHVMRLVVLMCWATINVAADQPTLQGRRLEDALQVLQQRGLRIVFSSEVVTPNMRVLVEPRTTTPRQQLDELLSPHNLKAASGPGGVILIVPRRPPSVTRASRDAASPVPGSAAASSAALSPVEYTDRVTVWGSRSKWLTRGTSDVTLNASALRAASSVLDLGALEAVHAMPRVAAADDFRSEFSVRGSPFRQIGVVIDGVPTRWLQHAVYGRSDAGSLSMLGSNVLGGLTLRPGPHPRRYDDALGAQLELNVREGSREAMQWRGMVGGTSTALVGEGPIGGAAPRGSWTAGLRNSYRSWPVRQLSVNDVGFAFADAHAKLVYDVTPTQQVSVTALGGRSTLETVDEPLVGAPAAGINRAALLTVGWRSILGSRTIIRQRAFLVGHELSTTAQTGQLAGRSTDRVLGYRSEALRSQFGGLLEAGADVSSVSGRRNVGIDAAGADDVFGATWTTRSAYVNFVHAIPGGASVETGVRVSHSTLIQQPALAPWIIGAWRFRTGWTLDASAGASRQFPDLDALVGMPGSPDLRPERATQVGTGIEQRFPNGVRWQVTIFNRVENDVLRAPELQPRLVRGVMVEPSRSDPYLNALHGRARGVDLLVARESTAGVSGWMSYTYALARQIDRGTSESYWSAADQRHVLNLAGVFPIGQRSSVSLVLRGVSGRPVPGYFDVRNGALFVGEHRNDIRLPAYVRLDGRVQRAFLSPRHRVIVFGEALNTLNRTNHGIAEGSVDPLTGEAIGFVRPLLSRRVSIGIEIALSR